MTATKKPDVTIYPTGDAWIADVEPVEQTVSHERAEELLAYQPAAFTTTKPKADPPSVESITQPADDAGATPQEA